MTMNHIDQLAQWWETADVEGIVHAGDTIIKKGRAGYDIYTAWSHEDGEDVTMWKYEQDPPVADYRILARAPKPKPAWHDAPAVTAKGREDWDHVEAFSRNDDYDPPRWIDNQGIPFTAEQLSDVTPLIEQKVTDEMVRRGAQAFPPAGVRFLLPHEVREVLAAALGLDPA